MSLTSIDWHMDDEYAVRVRSIHAEHRDSLVLEFDDQLGIYVNSAKAAIFAHALELAAQMMRVMAVEK